MVIDNAELDLGKVTIPIYNLATREDHIAPAKSAFLGSKFFGGPVKYRARRLGPYRGRGQSAGQEAKYQYWTGDEPIGSLDKWIEKATEHPGSWWPDWIEWIRKQDGATVPAREPGGGEVQADRGRAGQST